MCRCCIVGFFANNLWVLAELSPSSQLSAPPHSPPPRAAKTRLRWTRQIWKTWRKWKRRRREKMKTAKVGPDRRAPSSSFFFFLNRQARGLGILRFRNTDCSISSYLARRHFVLLRREKGVDATFRSFPGFIACSENNLVVWFVFHSWELGGKKLKGQIWKRKHTEECCWNNRISVGKKEQKSK